MRSGHDSAYLARIWYIDTVKTTTLTYKIDIDADKKTVFTYLSDWDKQSEWILFTTVRKVSIGPNNDGTLLLAETKVGPLKVVDTMLVSEWSPYEKIVVTHTGRIVLGKGIFEIKENSDHRCTFIWKEVTPIPFGYLGRIGLVIVKPLLKLVFNMSLRKLKKNVEASL